MAELVYAPVLGTGSVRIRSSSLLSSTKKSQDFLGFFIFGDGEASQLLGLRETRKAESYFLSAKNRRAGVAGT